MKNMGFAMKVLTATVKTEHCHWVLLQFAFQGCLWNKKSQAPHAACKEVTRVLGAWGRKGGDSTCEMRRAGGAGSRENCRSIIYN